jgi:hypothetical protein
MVYVQLVDRYGISVSQMTTDMHAEVLITPNMLSDDNTSNPKRFWSFIKSKRTESSGVAPLRKSSDLSSEMVYVQLVDRYGISVSQMTTDMFHLS